MKSAFADKTITPHDHSLEKVLGSTFPCWKSIVEFTLASCAATTEEWKFTGEKSGWSFRISDNKRVLVYMMPFEQSFQLSMVFGPKAFEKIIGSDISQDIITELKHARVYAEGRDPDLD